MRLVVENNYDDFVLTLIRIFRLSTLGSSFSNRSINFRACWIISEGSPCKRGSRKVICVRDVLSVIALPTSTH